MLFRSLCGCKRQAPRERRVERCDCIGNIYFSQRGAFSERAVFYLYYVRAQNDRFKRGTAGKRTRTYNATVNRNGNQARAIFKSVIADFVAQRRYVQFGERRATVKRVGRYFGRARNIEVVERGATVKGIRVDFCYFAFGNYVFERRAVSE